MAGLVSSHARRARVGLCASLGARIFISFPINQTVRQVRARVGLYVRLGLLIQSFLSKSSSQTVYIHTHKRLLPRRLLAHSTRYQYNRKSIAPRRHIRTTTTKRQTTTTKKQSKMSAILKSATILSGLALTGAAAYSTTKRSSTDFSPAATLASEFDASGKALSKPKL